LWWAGPSDVWRAARAARWDWIAAAVLLVIIDRALNAYRWIALLDPVMGPDRPPLPAILRVFFVSSYLGTFLPGSVGGDAVRTFALNRLNVPAADAFASVFVDRFLGVLSNLVMALTGLLIARDLARDPAVLAALLGAAGICAVAAAIIFNKQAGSASAGLARRLPGSAPGKIATSAVRGVRRYASERGVLTSVFAASVAVQVLRVLQAWCLGRSLEIPIGMSAYFAFIPVILIVMLLPITVNAIGTSQVAFVAMFSRAGVDAADSFALSVLFLALGLVGTLPGGVLYAVAPRERTSLIQH
jgi:uncharacterized membrane protein YbhN (UPF0104 family)